MKEALFSLPGIALTVCCWGAYGPVLHNGQDHLDHSRLKPLICVGLAYLLIAIIVPTIVLGMSRKLGGGWSVPGVLWSMAAGAAGALGALGIILALTAGGIPTYVMPLVFGCAPVVNVFVSMMFLRIPIKNINPVFIAGMILVSLGAVTVLLFAPGKEVDFQALITMGVVYSLPGIALTVLCWGSYGPVLHKGQHHLANNRLKPLICVGLAYLVIAIAVPTSVLASRGELAGGWTSLGVIWSMGAGALGAVGALGIILALTAGGKPTYVMPLVFGCAPIISVLVDVAFNPDVALSDIGSVFIAGLLLVSVGAVTVLVFQPRPSKKPAGKEKQPPHRDQPPQRDRPSAAAETDGKAAFGESDAPRQPEAPGQREAPAKEEGV